MIPRYTLVEHKTHPAIPLTLAERDALRRAHPRLRIEPTPGKDGHYDLTPDQQVGVIALPTLVLEIRPKVPLRSVLFLLSYACGLARWDDAQTELADSVELVELIAVLLARSIQHATRRGLLHGYRSEDEALPAPRGRILFDEQLRRRLGQAPPVEVRHDLFTADIVENRLLLAALDIARRLPLRAATTRHALARAERAFGEVRRVHYTPTALSEIRFTRLNAHYRTALALAAVVLRAASVDLGTGGARASAFLIDMNKVFEQFVRCALRETANLAPKSLPDRSPPLFLDETDHVELRPDLCVLAAGRVTWVGDAKYKLLADGDHRHADLYQLLAYTIALGLPSGTLIYAADGPAHTTDRIVRQSGKRLRLVALDLSGPPAAIRRQLLPVAADVEANRARLLAPLAS